MAPRRPRGPRHPTPLDAAYLAACFTICPDTGALLWRDTRPAEHFANRRVHAIWQTRCAGKPAGHLNDCGYVQVRILGQKLMAHRVAYALHTGHDVPPGHLVYFGPAGPADNRRANLIVKAMRPPKMALAA